MASVFSQGKDRQNCGKALESCVFFGATDMITKKPPQNGAVFPFNRKIDYLVITTRLTLLLPLLS